MSGIKRVWGICILIIIAQRLIELAEGYPVAVTYSRRTLIVTATVIAVQFVICIIVIQRTGNIFCVCFFRKRNGCNIYYFSFSSVSSVSIFPRFGITQGASSVKGADLISTTLVPVSFPFSASRRVPFGAQ